MDRLLVTVIGKPGSGKSETIKKLFDGVNRRTIKHPCELNLCNGEKVCIWVINGSPQEKDKKIECILNEEPLPRIVFCSIQYSLNGWNNMFDTLNFFRERGYFIYAHILSPGYDHEDYSLPNLRETVMHIFEMNSVVGIRDGGICAISRSEEIRDFIAGWAKRRGLTHPV